MHVHLRQFIQSLGAHPLTFGKAHHKYSLGNGAGQGRLGDTTHGVNHGKPSQRIH